jgi:CheY-like chemotaxis protein
MTPYLIVAVDDMPERYSELARRLHPFGWAVVTVENPRALIDLLDHSPIPVLAVLLDYDLRPAFLDDPGERQRVLWEVAGKPWTKTEAYIYGGLDYARDILAERSVPVIVTSANRPGSVAIAAVLAEYEVPYRVMSCLDAAPEERWIGALAEWAARVENTERRTA